MSFSRNFSRIIKKASKQPIYAVKVGLKRFSAYSAYYFSDGRAPFPESVTFFLTHRCNLKCKMCGQWGDHGVTKSESEEYIRRGLQFETIKEAIDELSKHGTNITLFGGEPFLFPEIISLINYIKNKKLHCLVITNGSLIKRYAEELVKAGLDELNLSLDGSQGVHDQIRGMKGLFNEISAGIAEINEYKRINGTKKPLINLQCTMNKDNYEKLEEMLLVAESLKADSLVFHNLIFLDKKQYAEQENFNRNILPENNSKTWEGFMFYPGINHEKLAEVMENIKRAKPKFAVSFYPDMDKNELREYYLSSDYCASSYGRRCISPWMAGYIFPDGELRPCLNNSYSFGNITGNKVGSLWNNSKALEFRRQLKKNKIFPACVRCTELFRY